MSHQESEEQKAARLARDNEELQRRAAEARNSDGRRADGEDDKPIISTPSDRRGLRRWFLAMSDNKVTGGLLLLLIVAAWGLLRDLGAATVDLYHSVPAHERALYGPSPRPYLPEDYPGLVREVQALKLRPTPPPQVMTPDDVERLRAFLDAQPKARRR